MIEQPAPVATDAIPSWELVIRDLEHYDSALVIEDARERDAIGRERYGVPLQAGNGRDSLRDAYDEIMDCCVYLRNVIEERKDHSVHSELMRHYRVSLSLCCSVRDELFARDGR